MRNERRHKKIWIGGIAALICLAAILCLSVRITEVTVSGNQKYTQEEVEALLFSGKWDKNFVYCYLKDKFEEHEKIPFVEDYKLVFTSPTKLEVIIHEKAVIGYVSYMGSNMYFDKDGIIVESSREQLAGIPMIKGLHFGHIVLYQTLPVAQEEVFKQIMDLTQLLSSHEIAVDEIYYDANLKVRMKMGDIIVELGSSENINGKISELADMMPVLPDTAGTLDLSTYDETNSDQWFSFKKKE